VPIDAERIVPESGFYCTVPPYVNNTVPCGVRVRRCGACGARGALGLEMCVLWLHMLAVAVDSCWSEGCVLGAGSCFEPPLLHRRSAPQIAKVK